MNTIKIANKEKPWKTRNQDVKEDEHNQGHKQSKPGGTKSQKELGWTKSEELGVEENEHDQYNDNMD